MHALHLGGAGTGVGVGTGVGGVVGVGIATSTLATTSSGKRGVARGRLELGLGVAGRLVCAASR